MIGEDTLTRARLLVQQIENGNDVEAKQTLEDLAKMRETDLFQEIGKLTRELHETLNNFRLDSRIADMAEQEIPDAKERLNYVISMTEQAANKTLTAVEDSLPVSEGLQQRSAELHEQWERFRKRDMSAAEFRDLSRELDDYFPQVRENAQNLQRNLSDVLMAQDFQDLTGQIIRRVINLVQDVEQSLVDLIRISGRAMTAKQNGAAGKNIKAEGPMVPGVDDVEPEAVLQGQDDVDDLLSSLGF